MFCSFCKKSGHVVNTCRNLVQDRNKKFQQVNKIHQRSFNGFNQKNYQQKRVEQGNKPRTSLPNQYNVNQKGKQPTQNPIVCHNCKKVGHKKSECRLLKQNVAIVDQVEELYLKENQPIKCNISLFDFQKEAKQAYEKLMKELEQFDDNVNMEVEDHYPPGYWDHVRQFTEEDNTICDHCSLVGHNKEQCRQIKCNVSVKCEKRSLTPEIETERHSYVCRCNYGVAENRIENRRLYFVRGLINNIEAKMVIDNGATATILNKLFADKHGLKLKPSTHTVMNADARITQVYGEVECELTFPGSRGYLLNMMVLEQCDEWEPAERVKVRTGQIRNAR